MQLTQEELLSKFTRNQLSTLWPLSGPPIFSIRPVSEFGVWEVYWKHLKFQLRSESEAYNLAETLNSLAFIVDVYQRRLEVDHVYRLEGSEMVPEYVPFVDRFSAYDGIDCRDATIQLIEEAYEECCKGGGTTAALLRRSSKAYWRGVYAIQDAVDFMVNFCDDLQRRWRSPKD